MPGECSRQKILNSFSLPLTKTQSQFTFRMKTGSESPRGVYLIEFISLEMIQSNTKLLMAVFHGSYLKTGFCCGNQRDLLK